jgi:hypothetical protein
MASSLEANKHQTQIIPFNSNYGHSKVLQEIPNFNPQITGLSMVFTSRSREFLNLSQNIREADYTGYIMVEDILHLSTVNSYSPNIHP